MEGAPSFIFNIAVLLFSVVLHEVSHGFVAERLGDPTARRAGRLTLNPLKHLDFFGSLFLPVALYFATSGQMVFGWAKPVPYNPANLKDPTRSAAKIALAGPLSNFLIAIAFAIFLRSAVGAGSVSSPLLIELFGRIVYLNILLAVFNLVPLPPLDGSKVLYAFLPSSEAGLNIQRFLERYQLIIIFIFIFYGFKLIVPIIHFIFSLFVGIPVRF